MLVDRTLSEQKQIVLIACISIFIGLCYVFVLNQSVKWAAYLFIAPFLLLLLYLYKNLQVKIALVVFLLIFVEKILVSQRQPLPFFTVGVSLVFLVIILMSVFDLESIVYLLQQKLFILSIFVLTPFLGIFLSQGRGYSFFYEQILNFQIYYIEFFFFFLLGFLTYKAPHQLEKLFLWLVIFGGLVAALHLYSIATGTNLESIRGAGEVAMHRNLAMDENWRYGGVFGNPNTMAAYYVMFAPIALLMLSMPGTLLKKICVFACLSMMVPSLIFAGSRGGLLFGTITFLIAIGMLRLQLKNFFFLLTAVILIAGMVKFTTENYFFDIFSLAVERFNEQGFDPGIRTEIWRASWEILLDNPFGIGLHWEIFQNELSRYSLLYFANPHNIYLSIALKGGFAGLVCFLIIVGRSFGKCIRVIRSDNQFLEGPAKYCLLAMTGFVLFGITEPIFSNGFKINHIIALVIGISWAMSLVCDEAITSAAPVEILSKEGGGK